MTPAFGFSIGDFIALTKLVNDIFRCVAAVPALRQEIDTVIEHYRALTDALQQIIRVCQQTPKLWMPATRNCVDLHLRRCREHLERFLSETRAVSGGVDVGGPSLRSLSLSASLQVVARRVAFAPRRKAVIDHLVEAVAPEREAIELYIDAVLT